jgi:hypothetical protein
LGIVFGGGVVAVTVTGPLTESGELTAVLVGSTVTGVEVTAGPVSICGSTGAGVAGVTTGAGLTTVLLGAGAAVITGAGEVGVTGFAGVYVSELLSNI